MAELVNKLNELQALPPELHWFCDSWTALDGSDAANPRQPSDKPLHNDLELRRTEAAECLTVYSYDDARNYQDALAASIDAQLGRCDICIEEYYKAKQKLVERLKHEYDEDDVRVVERAFNERDVARINRGLDNAAAMLRGMDKEKRHKNAIGVTNQLALFEALCNTAYLADETAMREHFQEPFVLVQTNKRLNIAKFVPAATVFLFGTDHDRWAWAEYTWSRYRTLPTKADFDFAIRDPLYATMQAVFGAMYDASALQRTWYGIGLIVENLDNELVTHSLKALDIDVFMLALEHLKYDVPGFRYLVETIQKLLELAPKDFWNSLGAISPTTFVEQIFNNKQFDMFVEQANAEDGEESLALRDMLSWVKPFMASLDTAHQVGVSRSICFQLLERLQAPRFPEYARIECYRCGLATLAWTLGNVSKDSAALGSTGRIVASDIVHIVATYVGSIVKMTNLPHADAKREPCAELSLRIVRLTLAVECKSLKVDQELFRNTKSAAKDMATDRQPQSTALWDTIATNIEYGNVELAKAALAGVTELTGLEMFKALHKDEPYFREKTAFNEILERLNHFACRVLERISDFALTDLEVLYHSHDSAVPLLASLFAADTELYQASVNLIKIKCSESARREAIGGLLRAGLGDTLNAFSAGLRRIARSRTYASCPRLLKTCGDVLDVLCNAEDGILRAEGVVVSEDVNALVAFWQSLWDGLRVIYEMTESWGKSKMDETEALKEFCRDTMQFSERLFDQYSIFDNTRNRLVGTTANEDVGNEDLLKAPAATMQLMVKWLRLRDLFLVSIAVNLTKKVLNRLTESGMHVSEPVAQFLEDVISGAPQARTYLTPQEKAELARALESNVGRPILQPLIDVDSETSTDRSRETSVGLTKVPQRRSKLQQIDLDSWRSKASAKSAEMSEDSEFADDNLADQVLLSATKSAEAIRRLKEQGQASAGQKLATHARKLSDLSVSQHDRMKSLKPIQPQASQASFREKREKEREAKKKRDAEKIAMLKKKAGVGQPLNDKTGLNDLGVLGKDHAPKGMSMMLSSGSESESEDDVDDAIFGSNAKAAKVSDAVREYQASRMAQARKGPVKKVKLARSAKDMRARLAPDLTSLHKAILGWEFFHDGEFPPGSQRTDFSLITNTFKTPIDYQNTFEPLLMLEAWQGFLKAKEESNFKRFEIKVANRMNVDAFLEIGTVMPAEEARELGIGEADIVLMSKGSQPATDLGQPHCLTRVWKVGRKKNMLEITYRANVTNDLLVALSPGSTLHCVKVSSITPLEREYGALQGLKYYDLCDEITRAKPSPLLEYTEKQLAPIVDIYKINLAQAKAIRSAVDNDAFTLIQGPPGSGKTKTIVAIVGALLTGSFTEQAQAIQTPYAAMHRQTRPPSKKLLVCAPSNAAVDELVMRFKQGVKTLDSRQHELSIIRLGRSDAINSSVMDVTLDELVTAKLNAAGKKPSSSEEIGKLMATHKATCESYNILRDTVDAIRASGKSVSHEQNREMEVLKRRKQELSNQIDQTRDSGDVAARDAEINRRHIQQQILDEAHVICATLSGSGHDMFQNLNIEFETVIIDEAAQSIELSALIPLKYGCSKCILVGDPKQLPPTVLSREAARFQYEQSLFVRMQANHPRDVHLLDTQYRMHPEISSFPSTVFYDGRLLNGPNMLAERTRPWHSSSVLSPYRFFDVQGIHQSAPRGHSLINLAEVDVAIKLYHRLTRDCKSFDFHGKIGIITPYKSQLRELRSRFAQRFGDDVLTAVEFNTTDAFQGRESEVIIFSCVRASLNKGIGFLSDIRRMNVGITRAKSSLWVLGNSQSLMQGEFWSRLIEDAKQRKRYTSGNLDALMSQPLLKADASVPISYEIDMPDAPPDSDRADNSRQRGPNNEPTTQGEMKEAQTTKPSGGMNGVNERSLKPQQHPTAPAERRHKSAAQSQHKSTEDLRTEVQHKRDRDAQTPQIPKLEVAAYTQHKRKREATSPTLPPDAARRAPGTNGPPPPGPKSYTHRSETDRIPSTLPPDIPREPRANNRPTASSSDEYSHRPKHGETQARAVDHSSNHDRTQASHTENQRQENVAPRPPGQIPMNVRRPKKKREVDPFVRPKNKR